MADPISLGSFGALASGAGAGISAFGALTGGGAQSQMFQYQAGVANLNKQIALQNADYALATGDVQAEKYGMAARERMGAIRAGEGAQNIDVGSGSKAAVQEGQQTVAGIDLATIANNAARKAYGYQVEATQDTAQAALDTQAASDAKAAGGIKAVASLVSGAGSVASKWYQGPSVGLNGGAGGAPGSDNSNMLQVGV